MPDNQYSHFRDPFLRRAGRIFRLAILFVFFFNLMSVSQNNTKTGGVCFRVDDNPSLIRLNQFDSIFQLHQQKFCMAITSWALPLSPAYVTQLKSFIASGHEVMDNTPTHQTQYFTLLDIQDTALYTNNWGVDHFNGQQVCLKYTSIDTTINHFEGPVNIFGNQLISANPGEFTNLNGNPYFFALYFKFNDKLCLWYDLQNKNPNDPDSLKLKSFWGEPLDLGTHWWASYHKLTQRDVHMHPSAIQLLGSRSLKIFDDLDIQRPVTWIHPAGQMPWLNAYEVKSYFGDSLSYIAGSNFINSAYFCYNETNPGDIKQFSLQTGDISIENYDLQWNKAQIANSFAKHFVKVDLSYFIHLQSDWTAYLQRVDSLLAWCVSSNIPVKTYHEWSTLVYDSLPGRTVNMFPKLHADLDGNNFPDGYDQDTTFGSTFLTTGGVAESNGRCFERGGAGNIFQITGLGGIEKGSNKFSIWVRRTAQDSSKVLAVFSFPESGSVETLEFPVDTTSWEEQFLIVNVPESASLVNILVKNEGQNQDTILVSGMDLRSAGFLTKTKYPEQEIVANEPFESVDLNTLVIDSIYSPADVTWTIQNHNILNLTILPGKILQVMKPVSFWSGNDSTYLIAHSPDGLKDSCYMKFTSLPITPGCSGVPIMLSLLDTLSNDIILWKSIPYDSSMTDTTIYNPVVAPKVTTQYLVTCINPLGNVNRDSITLERYPFPVPDLPADTGMCMGDSIILTARDGFRYLWNTGDTVASIVVRDSLTQYYSVAVTSEYECTTMDSTLVTVSERPVAQLYGLLPSYCANDYTATLYGLPPGGTMSSTSSGFSGNQFTPSLADPGINLVWYSYANQAGCADTDTVKVRVYPLPVIKALPDSVVCGGRTVILNAGSGFDNYQWSNGSIDSLTSVDSIGHGLGVYAVWVYVTRNGCVDRDTAYIQFVACPGMEDNELLGMFSIYPNPATDEFIIMQKSGKPELLKIQIMDMKGIVVKQMMLENISNKIPISGFPKGTYILRINKGTKQIDYKFIKI